jgi:hypothetical protein
MLLTTAASGAQGPSTALPGAFAHGNLAQDDNLECGRAMNAHEKLTDTITPTAANLDR